MLFFKIRYKINSQTDICSGELKSMQDIFEFLRNHNAAPLIEENWNIYKIEYFLGLFKKIHKINLFTLYMNGVIGISNIDLYNGRKTTYSLTENFRK